MYELGPQAGKGLHPVADTGARIQPHNYRKRLSVRVG